MAEKGKGRSLKDRLVDMGVLVEKDESPSAAQGSAAVSGPGALSGPGPGAGGVDRDLLKQLLAAATKDTNDYTEFMLSADAMSGVIPDEPTRIKAAFVASKPHGLTLEKILAGLASSKRVLEAKRGEFERVLSQKVDALVTSKQKQAQDHRLEEAGADTASGRHHGARAGGGEIQGGNRRRSDSNRGRQGQFPRGLQCRDHRTIFERRKGEDPTQGGVRRP